MDMDHFYVKITKKHPNPSQPQSHKAQKEKRKKVEILFYTSFLILSIIIVDNNIFPGSGKRRSAAQKFKIFDLGNVAYRRVLGNAAYREVLGNAAYREVH